MVAIAGELAAAGLPPLDRHAWIEVDIDQITANAAALEELVRPAALGAVVKADGYGHGLEMAARCAVRGGATWLCVATLAEAIRLRADGFGGRVFILYPVPRDMWPTAARLGFDVTVGGVGEARSIGASLNESTEPLRVHLEVDTGMTRGGAHPDDAVAAARALIDANRAQLVGLWTHLSAPENPTVTAAQVERLEEAIDRIAEAGAPVALRHAAASGGILTPYLAKHSFVRAGLALYGLHPGAGEDLPLAMAPALSVKAHPVRIADIATGTSVGYGGEWRARRPSRIATLPIGYADGWSRASSPGGMVLVRGVRAPIVGRVSSDAITVDVTDIADLGADSEFVLLGRQGSEEITADEVAAIRSTISWEVLQQLGSRLARLYRSQGSVVATRPESSTTVLRARGGRSDGYPPV